MADIGGLLEGVFVVALGAFILFAPTHAERINRALPFVRTGGRGRPFAGWAALVLGAAMILVWLAEHI
jgi:hypothetical protein